MNHKLATAGLLLGLSLPTLAQTQAPSSVSIYGVADVGLVRVSNSNGGSLSLVDSGRLWSSRLGFRGNEDLGGGLRAVFALEAGISFDTGASSNTFFGRQSYVGLSSAQWGTVTAGLQYTPIYDQLTVFSNGPTFGGHAAALDGAALPTSAGAVARFDNTVSGTRFANSLKYTSPAFGGVTLRAMHALGEVRGAHGSTASLGAGYKQGAWNAGLFYLTSQCGSATGCSTTQADNKLWVAGAQYDAGFARFATILSSQKNARNVKGNDATVAEVIASVPLGALTLSAGYGQMNDKTATDWDVRQFNLGAVYQLSKRTSLYGFWSGQKVDNGGRAHMLLLTSSNSKQKQFGAGMRHIF